MKQWATIIITLLLWQNTFAMNKKIHFASEATYPPFEYMDSQGNIIGFDIDVAKAICNKLEASCEFSNEPWSSLIPGVKLGKFDALISAIAITPERRKQVAFSLAYFSDTATFIASSSEVTDLSMQGIKGKTIGVQIGTVMENYLHSVYGNIVHVKTYASIIDAFLDIKSGRIDAVLVDTVIAKEWLNEPYAAGFSMKGRPINDPVFFGKGFGIAVNKKNQQLLQSINEALTTLKENGILDKIHQHYFGH